MNIERNKFRAWLEERNAHSPEYVIGYAQTDCNCPLANYLNAVTQQEVSVSPDTWWICERGSKTNEMPSWAKQFIHAVDNNIQSSVTASEALDILNSISD